MIRRWLLAMVLVGGVIPSATYASHSWGNYHWGRSSNPITLKLGDNLSSVWDSILVTASSDWSLSEILNTSVVSGSTSPKRCRPTGGRVEVCNATYGNNGWLGVAQIWTSGGHITQGVTKMNDTYFNKSAYNTLAWRNLVMCQEVGHTLGLDHQDEDFDNTPLGSCMDYSSDPNLNQHPNGHDYEQLGLIYGHLDSINTSKLAPAKSLLGNLEVPVEWGKLLKRKGRLAAYERDLGGEHKVFTFVVWADMDLEFEAFRNEFGRIIGE